MPVCPDCHYPLSSYLSGFYTMQVCLNCGHYESDSPAFKRMPELFKNCVRENPQRFLQKYIMSRRKVTGWDKRDETDEEVPEPKR